MYIFTYIDIYTYVDVYKYIHIYIYCIYIYKHKYVCTMYCTYSIHKYC